MSNIDTKHDTGALNSAEVPQTSIANEFDPNRVCLASASALPKTPSQVSRIRREAYCDLRFWHWLIVCLRPFICPFEEVLSRIPPGTPLVDVGCGAGIVTTLATATRR